MKGKKKVGIVISKNLSQKINKGEDIYDNF